MDKLHRAGRSMRNSPSGWKRSTPGRDRRIELLEENVERLGRITSSVERLATNMEGMLKEQERQGGAAGQAGGEARRQLEHRLSKAC